jgi:FAD/FMN-containing dehydrogenase
LPAYEWIDVITGFPTLSEAMLYGNGLGEEDGMLLKNVAVVAAPVAYEYFGRYQHYLRPDHHVAIAIVAEHALDALLAVTRRHRRADILFRGDRVPEAERKGLPPAFELTWNHTTLRALRQDPTITYLQVLYPFPRHIELVERIHARFGAELPAHVEFARIDGKVTCLGVPLVRFTSEDRLEEIIQIHEDMGAAIFNPHRYTLEEGGMKRTDEIQLAFKAETDPRGLLNPGKMIAWDDPDYDYRSGKIYLFPTLSERMAS